MQVTLDPKVTARALGAPFRNELYLEYGWGMAKVTLDPKVTARALGARYGDERRRRLRTRRARAWTRLVLNNKRTVLYFYRMHNVNDMLSSLYVL
jgi:hypothetical protein